MSLKALGTAEHNLGAWKVSFHEEFLPEFKEFSEPVRREAYAVLELLAQFGPQLRRPHADTLKGTKKQSNLKELRFHADNGAWRIVFAFDVTRQAILLVGGDKSGGSQRKFYRDLIETAERRFDQHQSALAVQKEK